MKSYHFYIALICFSCTMAQNSGETKIQEYLPPSPTAQEFMKYGEYPVSIYTGVPNISIPLYTIETRDLKIPISLNYHSSGIQVDQVATWVGLGWSLSSGGTISKVPKGGPDDGSSGYLTYDVPERNELAYDHSFYEAAATGSRDTESDIYYYNFAGYSGSFFFDRDKQVRLIEEAPILIEYSSGTFTITTQDGIVYEFNDTESTQTATSSAGNPISNPRNYVSSWHLSNIILKNKVDTISFSYENGDSFLTNQYQYTEATGNKPVPGECTPYVSNNVHDSAEIASQTQITHNPKRLTEIVFPNGKLVFNRAHDRQDIVQDRLNEVVIYKGEGETYNKIKSFELVHDYFYSSHATAYPLVLSEARRYRLKLTELHEYDKGHGDVKKHFFEYDETMLPPIETNGKDYWGYYNGKNSNYTLIPLQPYQYFGANIGNADREPDASFMQAGVLKKISYPTGGYTEFYYEPHEYITTEPDLVTRTENVFGVGEEGVIGGGTPYEDSVVFTPNYSGYATLSIEASDMNGIAPDNIFPTISLQIQGDNNYLVYHSVDPSTYSYPLNPPKVETTLNSVWLSEGVTYVLKAEVKGPSNSLEFDGAAYMIADISYNEAVDNPSPVTKMAGGLRIQQIKSFHRDNQLAFSKRYEYGGATLITPEVFLREHYVESVVEFGQSGFNNGNPECQGILCVTASATRRFYYGGTVKSLTLNGGSPVVYSRVDEFMTDGSGNDLGKTIYTYATQTDAILPVPTAYEGGIMVLKKDWMGGQNLSQVTYKDQQGTVEEVASETKGYTLKKYDESYMMYKIMHSKRYSGCYIGSETRYTIIEYPIYRGVKLVDSIQKVVTYDSDKKVMTTTSITYGNDTHLQPTRSETVSSEGNTIITKTYYPDDVITTTSLGETLTSQEKAAIDSLKYDKLHHIAEPVQKETIIEDGSGTVLSNAILRTNYKDFGNSLVLPEYVQSAKGTDVLDDRVEYLKYDDYGNPTEVAQTDGVVISYLWGYNGQLPIAKIENASYVEIAQTLGITETALENYDEGNLSAIDGLRSSLSTLMVTTYTYEPLVGVESITDPRGYTTYYEYDDFNRLKEVRDADKNIVTDYEYHYKD